jgi:aminoglycoside 3-N-acetyltransferase
MNGPLAGHDDVTEAVSPPVTSERLVHDLRELGIEAGQTLLVNASLGSIGWVAGGAPAVVAALRAVVGPAGNVVVPVGTEENSNFSRAQRDITAGMTWDELRAYRNLMPAFDKHTTPSGMGAIAEALRTTVGAVRSDHPQSSFAAIGPQAGQLMADHQLESHLGERSPLAKLYDRDAQVLMLGVGYGYCTAMHLAEYRYTARPPRQTYTCVVTTDGKRGWIGYHDVILDDNDFEEIGKSLAAEIAVRRGYVGHAECCLMSLRDTVDFATEWMAKYRQVDPELMRLGDLCKL